MDRRNQDGNGRKRAPVASNPARPANARQTPQPRGAQPQQIVRTGNYAQGYVPYSPKQPPYQKPNPRRKALALIVMILLLCVFVFAMYQVILYLVKSHQAKQEELMVQAMIAQSELAAEQAATAETETVPTIEPEVTAEPAETPAAMVLHAPIEARPEILQKFTQALSLNPDTVGQLQMGESINTYVVQRDNSYYLRRSFTGEYSFSGAIFLDVSCSIYPQSRMLIVHGHNMHDGTAFGKLSRYDDIDYLNQYPFIKFSTLYESARYTPFAVVYYSINSDSDKYLDVYQVNLMTDQEFAQFVTKIQGMSVYHIPVSVARTDQILMVTTCATGDSDMRFAVFAVKGDAI